MKLRRWFAWFQVAIGLVGLTLCLFVYFKYRNPINDSLHRMDQLAADVGNQAEIAGEMLDGWSILLRQIDQTITSHESSVRAVRETSRQIHHSADQWHRGLKEFAAISRDASSVLDDMAEHLPLKIPELQMETKKLAIDIPAVELKQQTIQLPYPTARVGSRKMKVNLGLSDLEFELPTLVVDSKNKPIRIPIANVGIAKTEEFVVPSNMQVVQRELMSREKRLLESTSQQLASAAHTLAESTATVSEVQNLIEQDLAQSLETTEHSLEVAQLSLRDTFQRQIPRFQKRLRSEQEHLRASQSDFRNLQGIAAWLFLWLSILPIAIMLQGMLNLAGNRHAANSIRSL